MLDNKSYKKLIQLLCYENPKKRNQLLNEIDEVFVN